MHSKIDASIACRVKGNIYIAPYFDSKEILVTAVAEIGYRTGRSTSI